MPLKGLTGIKDYIIVCPSPPSSMNQNTTYIALEYASKTNESVINLISFIEENREHFRDEYFKWQQSLSKITINGKELQKSYLFTPNLNYWWTTAFVENGNSGKSLWIDDLIKLLALKEIIDTVSYKRVTISGFNTNLTKAIENLTKTIQPKPSKVSHVRRANLYQILTQSPQIQWIYGWFFLLGWILKNLPFSLLDRHDEKIKKTHHAVVTYNILDANGDLNTTRYWGELFNCDEKQFKKVLWLSFRGTNQKFFLNLKNIYKIKKSVNSKERNWVTVESLMNLDLFIKIICQYFSLNFKYYGTKKELSEKFEITKIFFPLIKKELVKMHFGPTAILNLIYLNLFSEFASKASHLEKTLYLLENQGWERALCQTISKAGVETYGCVNGAIRFWDLRMYGQRNYNEFDNLKNMPNKILVNGEIGRQRLIAAGVRAEQIILIEAQRHIYLEKLTSKKTSKPPSIIFFGDYVEEINKKFFAFVKSAADELTLDFKIFVKPHPQSRVNLRDYGLERYDSSELDNSELLSNAHFIVTSHNTTSSLDGYIAGKNVFILNHPGKLKQSALEEENGVFFIYNHEQLVDLINKRKKLQNLTRKYQNCYLNISSSLTLWRNFFATSFFN